MRHRPAGPSVIARALNAVEACVFERTLSGYGRAPPARRPIRPLTSWRIWTGATGCETARVEYDPTQFNGTARYYRQGRPPYSAQLTDVLARELKLDGTGQLLDVGAGLARWVCNSPRFSST